MVDEDILGPQVIDALRRIGSVDVKTTFECGLKSGTKDNRLVAATTTKRRLLLTHNFRDINERVYEPCEHGGIILIKHPRPSAEEIYARMKAFCESGKRSEAKGHVTYLRSDRFTIYKEHKESVEERY
ncbi:MAG: DUF5615 family PIN-like protein [Acidobacteria bacterium]|nr:DUF5615 family PIN-like protein [Acidobacteriota bacterium]